MRRELILIAGAAVFGLAGGYAWTALTAPPAKGPGPAKAAMVAIPPSPEEQPLAPDAEWTAQADDNAVAAAAAAADNAAKPPAEQP